MIEVRAIVASAAIVAAGTAAGRRRLSAMQTIARQLLTKLGVWTAHPAAYLVLVVFTVTWLIVKPETFDWHGAATIATWFMTLLIVRAEHRDTQAIHAKLDELLKVEEGARTHLGEIDDEEPEEIEKRRKSER